MVKIGKFIKKESFGLLEARNGKFEVFIEKNDLCPLGVNKRIICITFLNKQELTLSYRKLVNTKRYLYTIRRIAFISI